MTKSTAAYYLWRLMLVSEGKKQEIVKVGSLPHFSKLVALGDEKARYNAIGALLALATSLENREKMCDATLVQALARCLLHTHDRTRCFAARLLAHFAELSPLLPRLVRALPAVLQVCDTASPGWANGANTQLNALHVVRAFATAPRGSEGLTETQTWRPRLIDEGAVQLLLRAADTARLPEARSHALVSLEALCDEPGIADELVELDAIPIVVKCLSDIHDESRAAAASVLYTISTEPDRLEALIPAIAAPWQGCKVVPSHSRTIRCPSPSS